MSMDKIFCCDDQGFCTGVINPGEFLQKSIEARDIAEKIFQMKREENASPHEQFASTVGFPADKCAQIFEHCETELSMLRDVDLNYNFDVEAGFDEAMVPRLPSKILEHLQTERERRLNPQNKSIALRALRYDSMDPRFISRKGFDKNMLFKQWTDIEEDVPLQENAANEARSKTRSMERPDPQFLMPPPGALRSEYVPWSQDDVLINVSIYLGYSRTLEYHEIRLGRLMKVTDRLVLRGEQTLYDLKKSFHCPQDYMCLEDVSHRNPTPDDLTLNLFPSSYFFIHDTFYLDTSKPDATDTSECVRQWAQGRNNIGEMFVHDMNIKLKDLKFRLGQPYLYQHQGICEHTLVFTDFHLRDYNDLVGPYPLRLLERPFRRIACMACRTEGADWAVMNCDHLPTTPGYLCRNCYRELLFHDDGTKKIKFQAVPYFDRKAMDDYGVFLDMLKNSVIPVKKEEIAENEEAFGRMPAPPQPSEPKRCRVETDEDNDDDDMSSYNGPSSMRSFGTSERRL